jgi:hypothetical protein
VGARPVGLGVGLYERLGEQVAGLSLSGGIWVLGEELEGLLEGRDRGLAAALEEVGAAAAAEGVGAQRGEVAGLREGEAEGAVELAVGFVEALEFDEGEGAAEEEGEALGVVAAVVAVEQGEAAVVGVEGGVVALGLALEGADALEGAGVAIRGGGGVAGEALGGEMGVGEADGELAGGLEERGEEDVGVGDVAVDADPEVVREGALGERLGFAGTTSLAEGRGAIIKIVGEPRVVVAEQAAVSCWLAA